MEDTPYSTPRIHNEKNLVIQKCGKSFSRSTHLNQHQRTNTEEKPYECNKCGKSFCQSAYLTQDQKIHSWEKPVWMKCGKAFIINANLIQHQGFGR